MGSNEVVFRLTFFALFIGLFAIRGYYAVRVRQAGETPFVVEREAVEREGRWSMVLRSILFLSMIGALILYGINPEWMRWFSAPLPTWLRWVGAGLGFLSLALLTWVQHTLGRYWSSGLQLRREHVLVTGGPYRWVRHPMYSAIFAFFVGGCLLSANWLLVLLAVAATIALYGRIKKEEAMMLERFGDEYRAYMQRTGRLLPRLTRGAD
jgi:protein-S-isoprenylcysteine O-methyltransferase Ste14